MEAGRAEAGRAERKGARRRSRSGARRAAGDLFNVREIREGGNGSVAEGRTTDPPPPPFGETSRPPPAASQPGCEEADTMATARQ